MWDEVSRPAVRSEQGPAHAGSRQGLTWKLIPGVVGSQWWGLSQRDTSTSGHSDYRPASVSELLKIYTTHMPAW